MMSNEALRTIHVGNLPLSVTRGYLENYFQQFGQVVKVTLKPKGPIQFAFIVFSTPNEAEYAVENSNYDKIHNNTISVSLNNPNIRRIRQASGNIVIRGIDESITEQYLDQVFKRFGSIISCKISRNRNGESRNIGYIQYENPAEAQLAIQETRGASIKGQPIEVDLYDPTDNSVNLMISQIPETVTNKYELNEWLETQIGKMNAGLIINGIIKTILLKLPNNDEYRDGIFVFNDIDSCRAVIDLIRAKCVQNVKTITNQESFRICSRNSELWDQYKIKQSVDKCIYVKNLQPDTTEEQLQELFSTYGTIEEIKITRNLKGIAAFVTFSNHEEAQNALKNSIFIVYPQDDGTYRQLYVDPYLTKQQVFMISPSMKQRIANSKIYLNTTLENCHASPSLMQRKDQLSNYQILALYDDRDLLNQWIETGQLTDDEEEDMN